MKCRNCGLPKEAHIKTTAGERSVLQCPNGTGTAYPATIAVKIELHYQAGEDRPWTAKWDDPSGAAGEVVAAHPAEALERAGREIERMSEEKTGEQIELEKVIHHRSE